MVFMLIAKAYDSVNGSSTWTRWEKNDGGNLSGYRFVRNALPSIHLHTFNERSPMKMKFNWFLGTCGRCLKYDEKAHS